MTPLLELNRVEAGYGVSQVLFGIDLRVMRGEVVTLLGRNGMGKSTTVKTILGVVRTLRGEIHFNGERIDCRPPERIARVGIAVAPEGRQIFPNLTVRENLVAFAANRIGSSEPWTFERVIELFPRLFERRENMGRYLSGGEQQMLAIGRALMTNPRLIILDEATEGLAPLIRNEIWKCLAALKRSGLAILVIDKYVQSLIEIADRHYIMERGGIAWAGDSASLACQHNLWERYLGVSTI